MAKETRIEWTQGADGKPGASWNCWIGCSHAGSPACDFCYAKRLDERWGRDFSKIRRTSTATFNAPLKWKEPRKIFICSMSDFYHKDVPILWRIDALSIIERCPQHTWLLLTKRPENIRAMDYANWCKKGWPSNVWLGVTVENQEQADKRIPLLLEIPVKTRFLSMEPLLGAVDLYRIPGALGYETSVDELPSLGSPEDTWSPGLINWTICGGESGPNARPMDLAWARSLRDQCKAGQVPFLMKQILEKGKKVPVEQWPVDLVVKEFPNEKHRQVANQEAQGL